MNKQLQLQLHISGPSMVAYKRQPVTKRLAQMQKNSYILSAELNRKTNSLMWLLANEYYCKFIKPTKEAIKL